MRPYLAVAIPFVTFAAGPVSVEAACTLSDVRPLLASRTGDDVELRFSADLTARGYDVIRVDAKARLLDVATEPSHLTVSGPIPALPVVDSGAALAAAGTLLLYHVRLDCGPTCDAGADTDGDRLNDCVESGTGVLVDASDTGSDPLDPDTDGDGIDDGDEVLGTLAGLDLPALGANPLRRDLFVEYDWFDDREDCAMHSHRPTPAIVDRVAAAFAAAPLVNPDGTSGIAFHQDYGQGGPFTGGNFIDDRDGVIAGHVEGADFRAYKAANFAADRHRYFHYCLLPHRYNTDSSSSGYAEINGDDFIVSLYCTNTTARVGNTIMHEIGHNLGLRHGGFSNCNWKPNYNSVMNYKYQFPGIDTDCEPAGDDRLDYSYGDRIELDENDLDESRGTCGAVPVDWDGDSVIETSIIYDVNRDSSGDPDNSGCSATVMVLNDHDDWGALNFLGITDADFTARPVELVECTNH